MKKNLFWILVVLEGVFANPTFATKECEELQVKFRSKVSVLPHHCEEDHECRALYLHPNSCARQYFLNELGERQFNHELQPLQKELKDACESEYKKYPS